MTPSRRAAFPRAGSGQDFNNLEPPGEGTVPADGPAIRISVSGRPMTAREACHGASIKKADAAASHGGPLADDHSQESRQLDVVPDGPPSPGAVPHSWLAESQHG